jgi:hypothetical protein
MGRHRSRRIVLVGACAALACSGTPEGAARRSDATGGGPHFAAVDLYGTSRVTAEQLVAGFGPRFAEFERASLAGDFEHASSDRAALEQQLTSEGGFAFARLSVVQYFQKGQPSYLTIDVVEPADAARRMDFAKGPDPNAPPLPDPDGLLARYAEYEKTGFDLLRAGKRLEDEASSRELLHCPFGFADPKLAPFREPLIAGARRHADELIQILHEDPDAQHRAYAAFLLGFTQDGARVVKELIPACRDPSALARNNAMRVLAAIARFHPEFEIPLDPVLTALEYPETTDRNKAAAILEPLSRKPELKEKIARAAGPTLVAMIRLKQPNNRDWAWQILRHVSGEDYADDDVESWSAWLAKVSH